LAGPALPTEATSETTEEPPGPARPEGADPSTESPPIAALPPEAACVVDGDDAAGAGFVAPSAALSDVGAKPL
jgi:hypothetical protein